MGSNRDNKRKSRQASTREARREAIESPLLTFREAMAYLKVTEAWLRRARSERRIRAVKTGHLVKFKKSDLDRYIEENTEPAVDR